MNYSIHQCHFCNGLLTKDTTYADTVACQNKDCKHNYHAEFRQGYTLVCFDIRNYTFTISDDPLETINEMGDVYYKDFESYRVKEELLITKDNYLQVVDRLRKLQVFK